MRNEHAFPVCDSVPDERRSTVAPVSTADQKLDAIGRVRRQLRVVGCAVVFGTIDRYHPVSPWVPSPHGAGGPFAKPRVNGRINGIGPMPSGVPSGHT